MIGLYFAAILLPVDKQVIIKGVGNRYSGSGVHSYQFGIRRSAKPLSAYRLKPCLCPKGKNEYTNH